MCVCYLSSIDPSVLRNECCMCMLYIYIHIYDLSEYVCINICIYPIGAIHEVCFSRSTLDDWAKPHCFKQRCTQHIIFGIVKFITNTIKVKMLTLKNTLIWIGYWLLAIADCPLPFAYVGCTTINSNANGNTWEKGRVLWLMHFENENYPMALFIRICNSQ